MIGQRPAPILKGLELKYEAGVEPRGLAQGRFGFVPAPFGSQGMAAIRVLLRVARQCAAAAGAAASAAGAAPSAGVAPSAGGVPSAEASAPSAAGAAAPG